MVRAFAHDAMGRRIDPSWWTHWAISHDWCNKGRGMLSCLWDDAYKRTLAANRRVVHVAAAGFLSPYLSGSLPCLTPHNRK